MTDARTRGGLALAALGTILAITAAWWAFALWPVPTDVPEWVLRTRAACFGTTATGLPNAGGWVLLIGEPIGMIGVLVTVWGDALRRDLRRLRATFTGQAVLVAALVLFVYGVGAATQRVRRARGVANVALFTPAPFSDPVSEARFSAPAPPLGLVDQRGQAFSLDALRGRRVMVTFAYAHCQTICPTIVKDLKNARRQAKAADAALVVVTLDPWRDTPSRLATIAEQWQLGADDRVLSGPVTDVLRVLDAWRVAHSRDERTGDVSHASAAALLDRDGRVRYRISGDWQRTAALLQTL
ncbi:MAG: SCO family protein [Gemmatimonadaceae bacterium]|nr:SCO family protein [Gemmatimonadaceae bacterium]